MQYPYYDLSVPIFKKILAQLNHLLETAEAFVKQTGIPESELLDARLAPDMFPLVKQVQLASDHAKGTVARLTGTTNPSMQDTETSLVELRERIAKTRTFLDSFTKEQFAGSETVKIELPRHPGKHFEAHAYVTEYALPNFFFHAATAYDILRMKGLQIGKSDFLGPLPLHDNQ